MDKSPLLITGAGRSDTKFLKETLNRPRQWGVVYYDGHEHYEELKLA